VTVDKLDVHFVASHQILGRSSYLKIVFEKPRAFREVRWVEQQGLAEQYTQAGHATAHRSRGPRVTQAGGTMYPKLGFALDNRALHLGQLRSRISDEPHFMVRQKRLAIGDETFEMSPCGPYSFELASLPISFTIELGGTRLTSSASEPRMRGDARDAEGDPVLHGDVSVANVDRAGC
jgi:hypothetical protein